MRLHYPIGILALWLCAHVCVAVSLPQSGPDTQVQYNMSVQSDAASQMLSMDPVPMSLDGLLVLPNSEGFSKYRFNGNPGYDYYLFYFSAHWCPPCRMFTPQLVDFYKQLSADNKKRVLVVFVSRDNSKDEMLSYMMQSQMPWPAIDYDQLSALPDPIKNLEGSGIPDLVLVNPSFKVLADSYVNGKYVGPQSVLTKTTALLQGSTTTTTTMTNTTTTTTSTAPAAMASAPCAKPAPTPAQN